MSLRLKIDSASGRFNEAFEGKYGAVARAITAAMREIADVGERRGRAAISAAGMGSRFVKAWRGDAYPSEPTVSVEAAAYLRHGIPFANVYDKPTTIQGRPFMWVASDSAPKTSFAGGRGSPKLKPKNFRQQVGKLYLVTKNVKRPLLMAPISVPRSQKTGPVPPFGYSELKQGQATPMRIDRRNRAYKVKRMVPIFVGVELFRTRRRFDVTGIVNRLRSRVASYYFKHLKDV